MADWRNRMDQIVNKVKAQLFAKGVDNMNQLQDIFLVSHILLFLTSFGSLCDPNGLFEKLLIRGDFKRLPKAQALQGQNQDWETQRGIQILLFD